MNSVPILGVGGTCSLPCQGCGGMKSVPILGVDYIVQCLSTLMFCLVEFGYINIITAWVVQYVAFYFYLFCGKKHNDGVIYILVSVVLEVDDHAKMMQQTTTIDLLSNLHNKYNTYLSFP